MDTYSIARVKKKSPKVTVKASRLSPFPTDTAQWIKLADELLEWSKLDTSIHLEAFPLSKGYSPHRFFKWVKHNDYFAEAIEYARYELCLRRTDAFNKGQLNPTLFFKTLPLYHSEIRELTLEKARQIGSSITYLPEVTPLSDADHKLNKIYEKLSS